MTTILPRCAECLLPFRFLSNRGLCIDCDTMRPPPPPAALLYTEPPPNNLKMLPTPNREPYAPLVDALEDLLARAKSGELRRFVGTGMDANGDRVATWADDGENRYSMLGGITDLQLQYHARTFAER